MVAAFLAVTALLAVGGPPAPDFNQQVRPILSQSCFACHGADSAARKANLRLDVPNRAVVPGDVLASRLFVRISRPDSDPQRMPPAASGHTLTAREKTFLARWIDGGAKYTPHWAFVPARRPVGDGIDFFIRARLAKTGLSPSPEADRRTLIRRVSLDLTGLPPTPTEVVAFVADRSPDAYEKVVDCLLDSPRFGEHWARLWLDIARYADTKGYEKDQPRTIWRWRDWVIDAFNADMPFDQFTIEQLAGDLLPNATESQKLATAFHRNTMTNDEGGTDDEEFRIAAVKDRVDTTAQVWMGLTMGCAKCHSHKYDPISQTDYYRFYALFNQTEDADRYDDAPLASMPTAAQKQRLAPLEARLAELCVAFGAATSERQAVWEKTFAGSSLWVPLSPDIAAAISGARLAMRADGAIVVSGKRAATDTYTLTFVMPDVRITALRLEVLNDPSLPHGGPGRDEADQNAILSEIAAEWIADNGSKTPISLTAPRADFEQEDWGIAGIVDGKPDTGWAWYPRNNQPHLAVFDLKTPLVARGGKLVVRLAQNYPNLAVGCFRLSVSAVDPLLLTADFRTLAEIAATPKEKRSADDQKRLDDAFRRQQNPALWAQFQQVQTERDALMKAVPRTPILRERPSDSRRVTRIHQRGNFLEPGEIVQPAVLTAFTSPPSPLPRSLILRSGRGSPRGMPLPFPSHPESTRRAIGRGAGGEVIEREVNRLDAARWLVAPENPLTPRVTVNRIWARFFGVGLVETEEDFGTQGMPPSHPELLDWLAIALRDDMKWSLKTLCKTIVLSATYRQSSRVTPELWKRDPRNRLLARGARFRLPAEVVRDQALAVSGLLSGKIGGPSVFPPQPPGVWKTTYSSQKWETSPGEDRWRRALYTFWRRTSPYPALTTFDAGSGEVCTIRRIRTNTPLQALVTLNDPAFVEAAGALARQLAAKGLSEGFRRVLARTATSAENARLTALFRETLAGFRRQPADARALLKDANITLTPADDPALLAAWTVIGNVLLNLDETLVKP